MTAAVIRQTVFPFLAVPAFLTVVFGGGHPTRLSSPLHGPRAPPAPRISSHVVPPGPATRPAPSAGRGPVSGTLAQRVGAPGGGGGGCAVWRAFVWAPWRRRGPCCARPWSARSRSAARAPRCPCSPLRHPPKQDAKPTPIPTPCVSRLAPQRRRARLGRHGSVWAGQASHAMVWQNTGPTPARARCDRPRPDTKARPRRRQVRRAGAVAPPWTGSDAQMAERYVHKDLCSIKNWSPQVRASPSSPISPCREFSVPRSRLLARPNSQAINPWAAQTCNSAWHQV